jgi:chorismate mutase
VAQKNYALAMADEKKDQRIPIMMSAREVDAIDAWRAKQPGLPARAEAVRRLIEKGLTQ